LIHRPFGYEPNTLPLRHVAISSCWELNPEYQLQMLV
jgi:hypothetical protein